MRFVIALLALGVVSVVPATASADPVYSQPYTTANAYYSYSGGITIYDNFTLSSAASITSVNWDGTAPSTPGISFTIDFYANNGGAPGALLFANSVGSSDATNTGASVYGHTIDSYNSSITPFVAAAGTEYWISIVGNSASFSPFAWSTGSGGDGTAYQSGEGSDDTIPTDLAFTLNTTNISPSPTPEPSSLILLGTGLVGVAGMAKRRLAAKRVSQS